MRDSAFAVWRRAGLRVVLADGYSMGRYEHLADEYSALDPRDGSSDIAELVALARTCDGVVTLADNSQLTAAMVAQAAGLPGIEPDVARIARSKLLQRRLGQAGGLPTPRWREVRTAEDIADFFAEGTTPAVLKPVDSAGSAGVLRVRDAIEARRQWPVARLMSPSRTVLIEEYVPGQEVCVDAIIVNGEPVFVSVCEPEYVGPDGFIAVSAVYAAEPVERGVATEEVRRLAGVYGLRNCVMQAEFKIAKGRWVLLEVTFRPGGALVPDLHERVDGVNLYEAQARLALGWAPAVPELDPTWQPVPYAQVRFLVGMGHVRAFVPPATVMRGLPDVRIVNQLVRTGQRVRHPLSEEGRVGYAVGWGDDRERLDAQLREALGRLSLAMGVVELVRDDTTSGDARALVAAARPGRAPP